MLKYKSKVTVCSTFLIKNSKNIMGTMSYKDNILAGFVNYPKESIENTLRAIHMNLQETDPR